jgi:hypothetical protein
VSVSLGYALGLWTDQTEIVQYVHSTYTTIVPNFFHPRQISATIIALVLRACHFFSLRVWYGAAIVRYNDV